MHYFILSKLEGVTRGQRISMTPPGQFHSKTRNVKHIDNKQILAPRSWWVEVIKIKVLLTIVRADNIDTNKVQDVGEDIRDSTYRDVYNR